MTTYRDAPRVVGPTEEERALKRLGWEPSTKGEQVWVDMGRDMGSGARRFMPGDFGAHVDGGRFRCAGYYADGSIIIVDFLPDDVYPRLPL